MLDSTYLIVGVDTTAFENNDESGCLIICLVICLSSFNILVFCLRWVADRSSSDMASIAWRLFEARLIGYFLPSTRGILSTATECSFACFILLDCPNDLSACSFND